MLITKEKDYRVDPLNEVIKANVIHSLPSRVTCHLMNHSMKIPDGPAFQLCPLQSLRALCLEALCLVLCSVATVLEFLNKGPVLSFWS